MFDWLARRVIAGLHLNRFYLEALAWPKLADHQVDELAAVAVDLTAMSPRYADLEARLSVSGAGLEFVEAHACIERLVADGYGLSARDLATIYDSSTSDRRGFWRHFASDPHSVAVVDSVLSAARDRQGRTPAQTLHS